MRDRGIRPEGDPHPVGGALDRRRDGVAATPVVGWREGRASNLGPAAAADLKRKFQWISALSQFGNNIEGSA